MSNQPKKGRFEVLTESVPRIIRKIYGDSHHHKEKANISDVKLLRRIAAKDSRAFEIFDERYADVVFRLIQNTYFWKTHNGKSEDLTQDVFLKVWDTAAKTFKGKGSAKAWLLRIARNTAIDELRRGRTREISLEDDGGEDCNCSGETIQADKALWSGQLPGPEPYTEEQELRRFIKKILFKLTEQQREVVNLIYGAGLTQEEVARVMGIDRATVASHHRNAKKKLKKLLEDRLRSSSLTLEDLLCRKH